MNHLLPHITDKLDLGRCFMSEELFSFDELVKVDHPENSLSQSYEKIYIHKSKVESCLELFDVGEREYQREEIYNRLQKIPT